MTVRDTSIEIYRKITESGLIGQKQLDVFRIIYANGPLTGSQISKQMQSLGFVSHVSETVRNRINELRNMGVVKELGKVPCPITGNTVYQYDITGNLPVRPEKKLPKKEERAIIKALLIDIGKTVPMSDEKKEVLQTIWKHVKKL
jgi:hypothetical protein